jgi:hypothetical protein
MMPTMGEEEENHPDGYSRVAALKEIKITPIFLLSKLVTVPASGLEVERNRINKTLFEFPKGCGCPRALAKGRYAFFEECGMVKPGKSSNGPGWFTKRPVRRVLNSPAGRRIRP